MTIKEVVNAIYKQINIRDLIGAICTGIVIGTATYLILQYFILTNIESVLYFK